MRGALSDNAASRTAGRTRAYIGGISVPDSPVKAAVFQDFEHKSTSTGIVTVAFMPMQDSLYPVYEKKQPGKNTCISVDIFAYCHSVVGDYLVILVRYYAWRQYQSGFRSR